MGTLVFLGPVLTEERQTIVFGLLTDALKQLLGSGIEVALLLVVGGSAIGALLVRCWPRNLSPESLVSQVLCTSWPWIALRWIGFAIVVAVYLDAGPAFLRWPDTGVTVVRDIGENVLIIYFAGLLFMPLLTEYGLMEFVGTLCRRPFRWLFNLPGRAAIDALTSVATASAIGLMVTVSQYQRGYYSAREACTIACNFSLVSIPFSLLIAQVAGIEHLFFGWYGSVLLVCIVCAVILSRVPPLSRIPTTAIVVATGAAGQPALEHGAWQAALRRAASGPGPGQYVRSVGQAFLINAAGVIGPSIALATLAAWLLFHSPILEFLSLPLALLLTAFGVTDAAAVASGIAVGFLDQFLPALVAGQLDTPLWRFVLAGLSVAQVIFLSEFVLLMLRSPLPIRLSQLFCLFLLRTAIATPMLVLLGLLLV